MITFWQKFKLWKKITLSIFLLGVFYLIVIQFIICGNIDFDLSKQQKYISCAKNSDCISESCGCLNSKGVNKFSFLTKLCGVGLKCIPPSDCKCQEGKCAGSFDDFIAGQACFDQSGCTDGFMCYKIEPGLKNVSCEEVGCECYKYCNSNDDCPKSMPKCSEIQTKDYLGICVK